MDADREPDCIVPTLSHAFVPHPALGEDGTRRATCGRCQVTRVTHPSGRLTFWKPAKLQPQD